MMISSLIVLDDFSLYVTTQRADWLSVYAARVSIFVLTFPLLGLSRLLPAGAISWATSLRPHLAQLSFTSSLAVNTAFSTLYATDVHLTHPSVS